jgi:hypothetical protein
MKTKQANINDSTSNIHDDVEIIDEPTFRSNMAAAGLAEQDYTLIKSMSTEDDAIEAATSLLHDVLIIDGDHSFAGVKADFVSPSQQQVTHIVVGALTAADG